MPRPTDQDTRILGPTWIPSRQRWRILVITPSAPRKEDRLTTSFYRTEDEANTVADDARLRLTNVTIDKAITMYERHLEESGTGPTRKETIRRLRLFFPKHDMLIGRIGPDRAQAYYDAFRKRTRPDGEPISIDYHRSTLINARSMMKWAIGKKWIAVNPFANVEGVGRRNAGKMQHSGDEARQLYRFCIERARAGDDAALAVLMVLLMALRASDVTRRDVRDVDLDATVLNVWHGKTKKSNRPREIPEALQPLLRQLVKGRSPFAPLFCSERADSGRHEPHWLWQAMQRLCVAAGVPRVCTHALKGTAGTLAARTGAMANAVADYLSHEDDGATAKRHYVAGGELEQAQAKRGLQVIAGGKR